MWCLPFSTRCSLSSSWPWSSPTGQLLLCILSRYRQCSGHFGHFVTQRHINNSLIVVMEVIGSSVSVILTMYKTTIQLILKAEGSIVNFKELGWIQMSSLQTCGLNPHGLLPYVPWLVRRHMNEDLWSRIPFSKYFFEWFLVVQYKHWRLWIIFQAKAGESPLEICCGLDESWIWTGLGTASVVKSGHLDSGFAVGSS